MDRDEYEKAKDEIVSILKQNSCVVYHVVKDQFLTGVSPFSINIDDLTEQERFYLAMAHDLSGEMVGFAQWSDDFFKSHRIHDLFGVYFIINSLLWQSEFDNCRFWLANDKEVVDFNSLFTRRRDMDFIADLLEEFEI